MQLRFLGRAYSTFPKHFSTIPSGKTACFRGQRYNLRAPIVNLKLEREKAQIDADIRKYRGVTYIV